MMEILALMLRLRVSAGKSSGVQSASSRSTVKVFAAFRDSIAHLQANLQDFVLSYCSLAGAAL